MRTVHSLVLDVGTVFDQVHPDERVVVETRDRIVSKRGEIKRELVAFGIQTAPPNTSRQNLVVTGLHQFTAKSVIDKDVAGLHAGRLELFDDIENDFERGMGFRLAVGNDLDANDVARLEKLLPTFHGIGASGQLFDSTVKRGLDRGGVAGAFTVHRSISHLDNTAWIEARAPRILSAACPRPHGALRYRRRPSLPRMPGLEWLTQAGLLPKRPENDGGSRYHTDSDIAWLAP